MRFAVFTAHQPRSAERSLTLRRVILDGCRDWSLTVTGEHVSLLFGACPFKSRLAKVEKCDHRTSYPAFPSPAR
jgi:hypothetical protein